MADLAALGDCDALWLLAATVLLHELGVPVPVAPVALVVGAGVALAGTGLLPPVAAIVTATLIGNAAWFAAATLVRGRRAQAAVPLFAHP